MNNNTDGYQDPESMDSEAPSLLQQQGGRYFAQSQALAEFRNYADIKKDQGRWPVLTQDELDRGLLAVFDAGYDFATNVAASNANLEHLAINSEENPNVVTPSQALAQYRCRYELKDLEQTSLLTSFIENRGLSNVFHEFMKLVEYEKSLQL